MKASSHTARALNAFSILEVVIVIALFSLLLIALFNIIFGHYSIYNSQQATVDISNAARNIMNEVNTAALQANRVVTSHAFSGINYTTGTSTVIFELPSVDSAGNIIAGTYDYIGIVATGSTAYRFINAANGSTRVSGSRRLTSNLSTLTFTYDTANPAASAKVDVDVQTQRQVKNQTIQAHLHQQVYLRNL